MLPALSLHRIPLSEPPLLARTFGSFGSSVHGLKGVEPYRNGFWVLNLTEGGEGILHLGNDAYPFGPGQAVIAPPHVEHWYEFSSPTRKTYAHFSAIAAETTQGFPVVQDLGERFAGAKACILEAAQVILANPDRARAMLWNLLWSLGDQQETKNQAIHHPVIQALLAWMHQHLADPVVPDELAFRFDCSAAHLNRLCHAAFGLPLLAHIRRCRLERAEYLLRHTTRRISDIAAELGYPDLQHFNKLMKAHCGQSPRRLRM